jgi:hypothetical protein
LLGHEPLKHPQQFLSVTVVFQQLLTTFIPEGQLPIIGSLFQEEADDVVVELFLGLVHLHLEAAEIVEQRVAVLLVDDPVHIGARPHEEFGDEEADFAVFEAGGFFHEAEEGDSEWNLVHEVGFVDFCVGEQEEADDLVVAAEAGGEERRLSVVFRLQVDVYLLVLQ